MPDPGRAPVRYRFGDFVLSPRQRQLTRHGAAVPLIPKYFDVLHLLVARRADAVSKAAIFEVVWSDVVVSDGALSQAVRTLRRTLGDDTREPRFIRTVSRHGYQFVAPGVVEEADEPLASGVDDGGSVAGDAASIAEARATDAERLVTRLVEAAARGPAGAADARDAAEELLQLGAADAVVRVSARHGHARALALLRDARWNVPDAHQVPLLGDAEAGAAVWHTIRLRLREGRAALVYRWTRAAASGALCGGAAGAVGGVLLRLAPASRATSEAPVALAVIGVLAGAVGAAGMGAGLAVAEASARSRRVLALTACTAVTGALAGGLAHLAVGALLSSLFGLDAVRVGGSLSGLALGGAMGLAYGLTTGGRPGGGMATPTGRRRATTALVVGAACAVVGLGLSALGEPLVGGLVHQVARAAATEALGLAPLGRLIGQPDFGPLTRSVLAAFECAVLGASTVWGLTARPRPKD